MVANEKWYGFKDKSVPNGMLLFGPHGSGKTYMAEKTCEHLKHFGVNVIDLTLDDIDHEKNEELIFEAFEKGKEHYKKTGKYTVINFTQDFDEFFVSRKKNTELIHEVRMFLACADDCRDEGVTWIGTTSNPQEIDPAIMRKRRIDIKLPFRNMKNFSAMDLLKYTLIKNGENKSAENLNYDEIANIMQEDMLAFTPAEYDKIIKKAIDKKNNSEELINSNMILDVMYERYRNKEQLFNPVEEAKFSDDKLYIENIETTEQPKDLKETLSIKITDTIENKINELLNIKYEEANEQENINELFDREEENNTLISTLKAEDLKIDDLKNVMVGNTSLLDFWLDLENSEFDKNKIKQNDRLKNIWFNTLIKDEEKVKNFISITLDKLQNENELIKTARESYKDIIENDTTITDNQKEILIKQQESLLFFKVISNKLNADDILKMEVNVLDTLEQLENEKSSIKENALDNVFAPARNSSALTGENAEDIENSEYIINLAKEAMLSDKFEDKENLNIALNKLSQAKLSGDKLLLDKSWNEIVNLAQKYFETAVLDDITNRNIALLNSINEKISDDDNKKIKDLTKDKTLSIEQREFIARYKDNKNFKILLNNQNINIKTIIEDLVFFESANETLLKKNNINEETINIVQTMSDKFKQINNENKDIKIQTDRVLDKLGEIETSISDFSSNFNSFANDMLDIETNEFQQIVMANEYLYAISNNTKDIKEYTQAVTKAKLVELRKDKHYKDIIPEITNLLPNDEQFNLKDFMQKVETLAKQEKDTKKKKTIIKAGIAVAGTLAVSAGAYYFGSQIMTHLASKLPIAQIGLATNEVIKATNVAKRIGNSKLISFGKSISSIQHNINILESKIKQLKESIKKQPQNTRLGIDLEYAIKQLKKYERELAKELKNTPKN